MAADPLSPVRKLDPEPIDPADAGTICVAARALGGVA